MTVAWITGGGTGIGRALAEALYAKGNSLVISGRRPEILEHAAREITSRPGTGNLLAVAGDASDPTHVQDVVSRAQSRWGDIDLLINNAGASFNREFDHTGVADYGKSFQLNCLTAIQATQAVLPGMLRANRGAIVNISSIYGKWASSRSAAYSVGKYAVAGYTDALRQSLVGTRIHVMGVYPGFIKTDMTMPFVQPGSFKSYLGETPDRLAQAVLGALQRNETELYFPWYVAWALRAHRWMPVWSNRLAQLVKR